MPSTPPTTDLSRHGERPFFTARTAPHAPSKDEEEGEGVDMFRRRPYRTLSILGTCCPPAPPMLLRLTARHRCRCMHAAAHGEKADLSNYAQADEDARDLAGTVPVQREFFFHLVVQPIEKKLELHSADSLNDLLSDCKVMK
ncbi:unnamed protein product [Sphagnum jensenii]|jgi:hypothetical protein|uniref:Uncharacterized protein n=1 Tax=Sphagnum jensenii TaxID=128206 RepID=A0ABP0XJ62_9BRYO